MAKLMNIGFGNVVNTDKILCIITPDSAPAKRQIQRAKEENRLIDATQGRRTRAVIFTARQPDTLAGRFGNEERMPEGKTD